MKTNKIGADILRRRMEEVPTAATGTTSPPPVPSGISEWMAKLKLLYNVPFQFLVAHAEMLPVESIKFFRLDPNWIACLEDGAFSIGSSTTAELAPQEVLLKSVQDESNKRLNAVRKKADAQPAAAVNEISGFLLRSAVVAGWPKLEVAGFSDSTNTTQLDLLRMSILAPDLVLCLFNGGLNSVTIREPAEGMHFGVIMPPHPEKPPSTYTHGLRYLTDGDGHTAGDQIPGTNGGDAPTVEIPTRGVQRNVINIAAAATSIQNGMKSQGYSGAFTSAEFALEMIEGVQSGFFEFEQSQSK